VFLSAHLVVAAASIQIELVLVELVPSFRLEETDSFDAPIIIIFVPNNALDCRRDLVDFTAYIDMDLVLLLRCTSLLPFFKLFP
jgi:hypothetical protein